MELFCGQTPVIAPQKLQNIDQRELKKATGTAFIQPATRALPTGFPGELVVCVTVPVSS